MNMRDCRHFVKCSAPICPMNKNSMKNGEWYPNEEICHNTEMRKNQRWVKTQYKIRNKTESNPAIGEFNVEMLARIRNVGKKISGMKDLKKWKILETWLQDHPVINTKSLSMIKRHIAAANRLAVYRVKSNV